MNLTRKITSLFLSAAMLMQSGGLFAQSFDPSKIFDGAFVKNKQSFKLNLPEVISPRAKNLTITSWAQAMNIRNSRTQDLLSIISDEKYMMSDNVYTQKSCAADYNGPLKCEFAYLTSILPQANFTLEESSKLVLFLSDKLKHPYALHDPKEKLYSLYSLIAASLAANNFASRDMLETLLNNVNGYYSKPAEQIWSARALSYIAYVPQVQQRRLIKGLEDTIYRLSSRMKYELVENHPFGLKVDNQYTAVKVFMYTISFFAKKADDGFLKSMVTTGTFVKRSAYLQNPLPGLDKKGNFMQTEEGQRHNLAFNLVSALFNAYAVTDNYQKMNSFIIQYARLNARQSDFANYFLFAIWGLELANAYNDNKSLEGWQQQYANFTYAISKAIWKAYPSVSVCVTVQGGAEVCAEWVAFVEATKLLGVLAKGAGKVFITMLPVKQALRMSFVIAERKALWRCAGKFVAAQVPARARGPIKALLVSGGFGLALKGDSSAQYGKTSAPVNIVMPREEITKKIVGK